MVKSPVGWALTPLKKYAQFSGRAPRAEWWWYFLFMFIVYVGFWLLFAGSVGSLAAAGADPSVGLLQAMGGGMIIMFLLWLALIIPTIAVQVRRVHDTDRSGWWVGAFYLLYLVYFVMLFGSMASVMSASVVETAEPGAGASAMILGTGLLGFAIFIYMIVLLVFFCLPGTPGPNKYGLDPYGEHENLEQVFS